jgi:hypothetical protein
MKGPAGIVVRERFLLRLFLSKKVEEVPSGGPNQATTS